MANRIESREAIKDDRCRSAQNAGIYTPFHRHRGEEMSGEWTAERAQAVRRAIHDTVGKVTLQSPGYKDGHARAQEIATQLFMAISDKCESATDNDLRVAVVAIFTYFNSYLLPALREDSHLRQTLRDEDYSR